MRAAIVFTLFSVLVWTGENDSITLRLDACFLKNRGQNSPFSKVFGYLWTGPKPTAFFAVLSSRRRRCLRSPLSFLLIISSLLSPKCTWWTSTHTFTPYLPLFRNTHAHSEVFRLQKHHNLIEYFRCHYIQNTISLLYKELKGPWCHRDLHCEILKGEHFAKKSVSNISSLCHHLLDTVQRYTFYRTKQKLLAHDETRNPFAIFRVAFQSGADPGLFLGGGALVSCSTSTPMNQTVFFYFFAEYQLY